MQIHKNDYNKNEDETLWELHEVRYKLYKDLEKKSTDQINKDALKKIQDWKGSKVKKIAVR